jgi:phage head maturation protease
VEHETSTIDRSAVEAMQPRGSFSFEIADATQDGDKLRIKGFANSFRPMRSGRVLLRQPYIKWAKGKGRTLSMLANHGYGAGFGSIGLWNTFAYDEKRGMAMEGWIGSGTTLMDEARVLVQQGVLRNISVGWTSRQARWVTVDDKDIDPALKSVMDEDGVRECYCFIDYELVEASLVDVPDDPRATLAGGSAQFSVLSAQIEQLRTLIDRQSLAHMPDHGTALEKNAIARAEVAAERVAQATIEKLFPPLQAALLEHMELIALDRDAAYGAALLDADTDPAHEGCAAHGDRSTAGAKRSDDLGALLERVRKM